MQARYANVLFSFAVVVGCLVSATSCSRGLWIRSAEEAPATVQAPEPTPPSPREDVDWFGKTRRSGGGIEFAAKAATDLQQHTAPSEGADFDPDIDPTGSSIVYASTRHSRNSHLYLKRVGGATMTQITDGPANDAQPEFDPTGTKIAFTSDRSGHWDIWVVDVNGRNPVQITNNQNPELHPSWSPDGRRLVYCRMDPKDNRSSLWIVELNNPGVKRLIGDGLFPSWSPNGDKIAYQRARERSSRRFSIWTIDISEDEVLYPTEVASSPYGALISPSWAPDATQLAFTFVEPRELMGDPQSVTPVRVSTADIGIVDVDGRGLMRLTSGRSEHYSPTWSKSGRIYFSTREGLSETIWSVKPFRLTIFDQPPSATSPSKRRAVRVFAPEIEE